ncbi:MAG: methionine gamma-lyase family protein, partial [Clostridia bacterium]|nr:methionine gamma-lyase family protein [Clostridia bacterium]
MDKNEFIQKSFDISAETLRLVEEAENEVKPSFKRIEEIAEINQLRVMKAFSDNRVSDTHFMPTTGYGYDDIGRDTLDKVYADIFEAEDALVRHNFISGTHTISTALFAVLRPGDTLVS